MALKSAARWVVWSVLFIIPFLPLVVFNDTFFPFITSKGFVFRMLVEVGVGAWLLLALSDKAYRPKFSWTLALYAGLMAWMFVANLFAVNAHKAFWSNYERMDGWVTIVHVFLFFIIATSVLSADKLWKRWWMTVLGASVLVAGHGVLQLLCAGNACAQNFPIHQGGARVDANFGNAIYLAVYFMFTVLVAVWQAIESKGWLRYSLIALAVLETILIFFSATRGVILGLFAAAGFVALLWMTSAKGKGRTIAAGVIAALVLMAGGFFLIRDSSFVQNEPTLTRLASVFNASELKVRMTLWGMALQGSAERPITGWGQEGYNYVFNKYYQPSLYAQEPWFDRAHNMYLDWLIAGGIPALLLFVGLLGTAMLALYRSKVPKAQKLLLLGALAGYALQAVTAFDNLFSYVLLAGVLAMAHDASARPVKRFQELAEVDSNTLGTVGAPVLLVATVAVLWVVNIPSMQAAGDLIKATRQAQNPSVAIATYTQAVNRGSFASQEIDEQILTYANAIGNIPSVPADVRQAVFTFALTEMQKEVLRTSTDARTRLIYAGGLRSAGDIAGFNKEIDAALALSPKKQTLYIQKGIVAWQAGDKASAAKLFQQAYDLDTSFKTVAMYAAIGRIITGDIVGGKALLVEKHGTTAIDDDILRFAFYEGKMFSELVDSAKAGVENSPQNPQSHLILVQAYILAGRLAEARTELQATLTAFPETATAAAPFSKQLGL